MLLEFLNALGGVALIVFGVRFLRKGLGKMVGAKLPIWVGRVTGGVFRTALAGIGVGLIAPSTSSQGLLAVSLVRDGTLGLRRGFVLLMGAYLGATLLLHLVALDVGSMAGIGVLFGVVLFQGMRGRSLRGLGQVVLSVSFVLMGVQIVGGLAGELSRSEDLREVVRILEGYPFLAAAFAALVAALVQSSTATLAMFMGFALHDGDLVTPELVLEVVIGANVGIAGVALLSGWTDVASRRFALGVLLLRGLVGCVVLLGVGRFSGWLDSLPLNSAQFGAWTHTGFNVGVLLVSMPVAGLLERLVTGLVRAPSRGAMGPSPIDDRWAEVPEMAFTQTKREIGLALRVATSMLDDAWSALEKRDAALMEAVRCRDDAVDQINRNVRRFLTRQLTDELEEKDARRRVLQLRYMGDLESIADVIDGHVGAIVEKTKRRGLWFSDEEWDELRAVLRMTRDAMELSGAAFGEERAGLARELLALKDRVRDEELRLRERHYARLQEGDRESHETADLYVDLLGELKHIVHLASGVSYGVLELSGDLPSGQRAGADSLRRGGLGAQRNASSGRGGGVGLGAEGGDGVVSPGGA
ncbi:MAG: Na/Pi cotransporter family protein [Phycisphaerales bacterium]